MMRTLVTGAAGFTGRYLTTLLANRGHEVHGLVHDADHCAVTDATAIHVADLADQEAVARVIEIVRPQKVVHLAGVAFVAHGDIEEIYRSNVLGTRQLLDALSKAAELPTSVLLASSANVYGNCRHGILDETTPFAPANDYGVSKVAAEYVAGLYRTRLPLIVVRPFNYTGRGQSEAFLIPKIVRHTRQRAPYIELGNMDVARDFSDVRVVVDAYARLLETPAAIGGTFNMCSGRAVSLRDLLALTAEVSGHRLEVRINPAFVRADEVKSLAGSAEKLKGAIGELEDISLSETLRWMLTAE